MARSSGNVGAAVPLWVVAGLILVGLALYFVTARAHAQPPEGADPDSPIAEWFRSLKQTGTVTDSSGGISCCSVADCRPTDYRIANGEYEIPADDGGWVPVPADRVIRRDNPVGRAIACRSAYDGRILCFVSASES